MDISVLLADEISIILLWVGLHGLLDQAILSDLIYPLRNYIYIFFILFALYIKVP
jgi:hypothetical protein